jgi:hypothetical protein
MKLNSFLFIACLVCLQPGCMLAQVNASNLSGAWETKMGENNVVMICADKYFSAAVYRTADKTFIGTCGGTFDVINDKFVEVHEFNTMKPELIGVKVETPVELREGKLVFIESNVTQSWNRMDDGKQTALAGAWLITSRKQDNVMVDIKPGARRTMKILSGTRFQWIAYNVDTKEFFGTGGGMYVADDGKYIEKIEFFSRDSTRVGSMLMFNFEFSEGRWHHSGLSSKGDPIDEMWTKREKIEL